MADSIFALPEPILPPHDDTPHEAQDNPRSLQDKDTHTASHNDNVNELSFALPEPVLPNTQDDTSTGSIPPLTMPSPLGESLPPLTAPDMHNVAGIHIDTSMNSNTYTDNKGSSDNGVFTSVSSSRDSRLELAQAELNRLVDYQEREIATDSLNNRTTFEDSPLITDILNSDNGDSEESYFSRAVKDSHSRIVADSQVKVLYDSNELAQPDSKDFNADKWRLAFFLEDGTHREDNIYDEFDIDDVLNRAIELRASDVHIFADRFIKLRIDGKLYSWARYGIMDRDEVTKRITEPSYHLITKVNENELMETKSADSAYTVRSGQHVNERFRVHFLHSLDTFGIVFRHIRPEIFTPEEIGITSDVLEWTKLNKGLVLITGPTGSGKSATFASMIRYAQLTRPDKIITLEQPIETLFPATDGVADIWQREVGKGLDTLSFSDGIRDAMREDPDIILIGEIRDYETVSAALEACNTGHLVFATVHANSAPDVIQRLGDLAMKDSTQSSRASVLSDVARNLQGVVSQRLCLKSGGVGRVAVREVLHIDTAELHSMVRDGDIAGIDSILHSRHRDLDSALVDSVLRGVADMESARSLASDVVLFDKCIAQNSAK